MGDLPEVLVIGSGGTKIFKTLGFLTPLMDVNHLQNVRIYAGVSVGAIISLFIIAGYNIREINREVSLIDIFNSFSNIWDMYSNKGMISVESIRQQITSKISYRFSNRVPTLAELKEETGKELVVGTYNLTDKKMVMMSRHNFPNISCVEAVLCSINIPFVFQEIFYQNKNYKDGALGNPYPIDYFDNGETPILGIYMKSVDTVVSTIRTNPLLKELNVIIQGILEQKTEESIRRCSEKCHHVELLVESDQLVNLKIDYETKGKLLSSGYNEGKKFLENLENHFIAVLPPLEKYPY